MQKEAFENKKLQFGRITIKDKSECIYKGYFLDGQRHGPGVETYKYVTYEALYAAGYTFDDGDTYEGEFKNGQKNGRGKLI